MCCVKVEGFTGKIKINSAWVSYVRILRKKPICAKLNMNIRELSQHPLVSISLPPSVFFNIAFVAFALCACQPRKFWPRCVLLVRQRVFVTTPQLSAMAIPGNSNELCYFCILGARPSSSNPIVIPFRIGYTHPNAALAYRSCYI